MADLGVTPFQEPPICFSISGWWFGFLLFFHYIGNTHPNWLSYFSDGLKSTDMFGLRYVQACEVKKEALDDWSFRSPSHINDKSIHLHIHISYIYIYIIYIYIAIYTYYIFLYIYIYIQDQHRIFASFQHLSINSSTSPRLRSIPGQGEASKRPLGGREVSDVQRFQWEIHGKSVGKVKDQWENHGKLG